MKTNSMLPTWEMYGPYSGNYGTHCLRFRFGGNDFWFSYNTLVAFQAGMGPVYVHANEWGPTTGKHLNAIDNGRKDRRLCAAEFDAKFHELFGTPRG